MCLGRPRPISGANHTHTPHTHTTTTTTRESRDVLERPGRFANPRIGVYLNRSLGPSFIFIQLRLTRIQTLYPCLLVFYEAFTAFLVRINWFSVSLSFPFPRQRTAHLLPDSTHNVISFNNISNILRHFHEKPPHDNRKCG